MEFIFESLCRDEGFIGKDERIHTISDQDNSYELQDLIIDIGGNGIVTFIADVIDELTDPDMIQERRYRIKKEDVRLRQSSQDPTTLMLFDKNRPVLMLYI